MRQLSSGVNRFHLHSALMAAAGLVAVAWVPVAAYAQAAVEVRVVTGRGEPMNAAVVFLRSLPDSTVRQQGETDATGRVVFEGVASGRYTVSAERLAYSTSAATMEVGVDRVHVELRLREAALGLPVVRAEAERRRARFEENVGATLAELTQRDLKLLPSVGEADVLRAIEVLPGVVSTSDFSSAFNVRGGAADQNLILLDGIPIYNPFHLGGLFSVFNADMVSRAELLAGGFPARYGGRVASVLNVESDPGPGGTDVQAGLSLLATRVAAGFDVPDRVLSGIGLGAGRTRVSVRRSYFDQLLKPFFDFPYHLRDVQLYGEAWTAKGGRIALTAYTGRDVLDLSGLDSFPLLVRWTWGNDMAGGSWVQPVGRSGLLTVRAGHTRFATDIRFPEFGDTEFRSRIGQSLARAELMGRSGPGEYTAGVAVDRLSYDNLAASGGTVFREARESSWLIGGFGQARLEHESWQVEAGLRVDAWIPEGSRTAVLPAPRLAVRRFIGGRDAAVRMAVGRYTQFAHSLRDEELPLGIDIWMLAGARAPYIVSDQVQAGIEGYVRGGWFAALEAFHRTFDGVITNNAADDPNDLTDDVVKGTGRSYGADLHVRREGGRVRPMLAVSWLRAWREYPDVLSGADPAESVRYAPIFDRRIDVDLVVQAQLPRDVELGVRLNYGSGLPYTRPLGAYAYWDYSVERGWWKPGAPGFDDAQSAIVLGPRNAERYPSYVRLDAGVRRTWPRRWGSLTPYVDVLNILNRRNVLFYYYQYGTIPATRSGISMFPFLPTAGVEVRF